MISILDFDFKCKNFKRAFWDWFDNLPKSERQKFNYYQNDMAELFFFNKVYRYNASVTRSATNGD